MPTRLSTLLLALGLVACGLNAAAVAQESHYRPVAPLQLRTEPLEVQAATAAPARPQAEPRRPAAGRQRTGLALPARGEGAERAKGPASVRSGSPIFTVLSGLAIVLGLFALVVWAARRGMPQAAAPLPPDVIQVLGRSPLAHRQNMHLVRVGNKLLLLCVTPQGAETLTEIVDPLQVEQLVSACERNRPGSITATFRQVLAQVGEERAAPGFLGNEVPSSRALKIRRQE